MAQPNREVEENEKRHRTFVIETALGSIEKIFDRGITMKDPVIRYTLFLERLYMFLDVALSASDAALKSHLEDFEMIDEHANRTKKLGETIKSEMRALMNWIQSPQYGPDHPVGRAMMKTAQNDFSDRVKEREGIVISADRL